MGEILSSETRQGLLARHRTERDGRIKDRMKVVLLYDDGWSFRSIAEALFLSEEGVRKQFQDYIVSSGLKLKPENGGSNAFLNDTDSALLISHLESSLYNKVSDICYYVHQSYGVRYSISGMTDWLHRQGFSFHKPCGVPAKADGEAQEVHIASYEMTKRSMEEEDHLVFMDGVHPTHTVRLTGGWIRRGQRKEIPTNGCQRRLNILGALDLEKMTLHAKEYKTIDGEAIIAFLSYLLIAMPKGTIHVVLDQARYHTCNAVKEWLAKQPRMKLHYLPPYSPNLNPIEPLWKIMHEHTTNNMYHASFKQFSEKIWNFLDYTFPRMAYQWTDRLTDNFRVMSAKKLA